MKIFIVETMSAEPYEDSSWIEKVFDSLEKAEKYKEDKGLEQEGLDIYDQYIYMIQEHEIE